MGAVEIKLGSGYIEGAAKRPDGVYVVSIGSLKN